MERSKPRVRRALVAVLLAVLAVVTAGAVPAGAEAPVRARAATAATAAHGRSVRPVVFVHGGAGSGAQFEVQAQRFTTNGYPAARVAVHEYDSTFGLNTMAQVHAGLDALIADLRADTGAAQVDLVGHSLGTAVSQGYLSTPERAATVAHYVNVDGAAAPAPPGGVPTLAVWAEGNQARQIVGAENLYLPDQSHVQAATSPETFAAMYETFTGRAPRTTGVRPERGHRATLAGEANLFPSNAGAAGATLDIWEVDRRTGERRGRRPRASFTIGADGAWGPFRGDGRKSYELVLTQGEQVLHQYAPPYGRSDHLIRILTSEPGGGIGALRETSDRHASIGVTRYQEWWGDQGAAGDRLEIDGHQVLTPAIAPRSKRVNAVFAFDRGTDGVTDLAAPLPTFFALPFITGADVYVPATLPPDRSVRVAMTARTGGGDTVAVNVPAWASTHHHISVVFPGGEV